jgi:ATP-dependent protease ClpP protease subunit
MSNDTTVPDTSKQEFRSAVTELKRAEAELSRVHRQLAEQELATQRELDAMRLESQRLDLEGLRIEHGSKLRAERLLKTDPFWLHTYTFDTGMDPATCSKLIVTTQAWSVDSPGCDMTIIINSPGGQVIPTFGAYDHLLSLRKRGHHITTVGRGMVASAATILFQAGDERIIGSETSTLIHEISTIALGKLPDLEDEVAFAKALQERILNIYVSRCGGKTTKEYLRDHWARKDWWLDADEIIDLGLADEIG